MSKLSVLLVVGALLPVTVLFACATDNGDAVHGPQFGPPPERSDGASDGPVAEDGGPLPGEGGGADADADAGPPSTCAAGTVVVLAGSDTALTGAVQLKGGPWSGAAIAGGAAMSPPALVPFGIGFAGLTRGAGDALQAVTYGTSWSAPVAVGTTTTTSSPALTVLGTKAEGVFRSGTLDTNKFFRIENTATSWSATTDPVGVGGLQSVGLSAAAIAPAGTDLVFAQAGTDNGLYVRSWDGAATWSPSVGINGAGVLTTAAPALVAVDGTFDLVLLYAAKDAPNTIGFATRTASSKAWSSAQITQATAQTAEQMSVARISQFVILVTFRGNNQRPYYMTGTLGAAAVSWSTPAPLLADTSTVDAVPAVAKGVCADDGIAVFGSGGQVKATRYRGSTWTVPEAVSGAAGGRVSIATR